MTNAYYSFLNNRAGISITGSDAADFLQGLITQDITILNDQPLAYSALLTPQGKVDYDFFIIKQADGYILECEGDRAEALLKRFAAFKLRKNIELKLVPIHVLVMWGDVDALKVFSHPADPRHLGLGYRKISIELIDTKQFNGVIATEELFYNRLCLGLGVPNGRRDIAIGEDTVEDIHLNTLNGVSYTKGCYMGQELTSRMHHRALTKKGLYIVAITGTPLPPFTDILVDGNLIGEMRSSDGDIGLAVLRHDSLKLAERAGLTVQGTEP